MTKKKTIIGIVSAVAIMALLFPIAVLAEDLVVIGNKKAPDAELSKSEVKKIYSGNKTKWSNNEAIILTVVKDSDVHKAFLKEYVKKSPSQFERTWKQMVFTGKGRAPKKFDSLEEMIDFIAENEGAIGYAKTGVESDKVLIIKGK